MVNFSLGKFVGSLEVKCLLGKEKIMNLTTGLLCMYCTNLRAVEEKNPGSSRNNRVQQ